MKCTVCGRPGKVMKAVNWRGQPMPDLGVCCSPKCGALVAEADHQAQTSAAADAFERYMIHDLSRRWRARRAEQQGLPFTEPELKTPAEQEIERICLRRWGRLPEDIIAEPPDHD